MFHLTALLALSQMGSSPSAQGLASIVSPNVAEVVSWLPPDCEAMTVVQEPGAIHPLADHYSIRDGISLLAFLELPDPEHPLTFKYDFVVEGSRNSRMPKDLGLMPFDGCFVAAMRQDQLKGVEAAVKKLANHTGMVGGRNTYVVQAKVMQDSWTWYVSFDHEYMYSSTSKDFYLQVLGREGKPHADRALPDSLEQWKYIEPGAPYFSVRQLPPMIAQRDRAIGYAAWLQRDKKRFDLLFISDDKGRAKQFASGWKDLLKQEGWDHADQPNDVDARISTLSLDAQADGGEKPIYYIAAIIGHAIIV